ncbi:MAG TPA: right-handed parallel beta-helix repeat-containing protein [Pyrinomonadaceae bacterium]|jgi:parallel beta-helix repeat protein
MFGKSFQRRRRVASSLFLLSCLCLVASVCLTACAERTAATPASRALYVSTRGDDARRGETPETALRTINAALERVRPGTTIFIEQGTYYEQVVMKRGGAPNLEVTLTSYKGTAIIDGSREKQTRGGNQNRALVELRRPYTRLVNLEIVNSENTGILLDADNLTVEGCRISRAKLHAISTDTSRQNNSRRNASLIRNIVIKDNTVSEAVLKGQGYGQAISLIADGFTVSGNTVRDNMTEGIDIWLGATHGEVVGNTVYNNKSTGIYVDGASYVRIHRNQVYRNRAGIGVSSENANYDTHDIWVFNNVAYDNADSGCFIWDERSRRGYKGSQNVLIAHNTLVGNRYAVYLAGEKNSGEILNNLGYSTGEQVLDNAAQSSFKIHDNVWLARVSGFASTSAKDFRLTRNSPAIDKGVALPSFTDDAGAVFNIDTDFSGYRRPVAAHPDAGAYEYR